MKITSNEITELIKGFKQLVEMDINGITSTDARNTVTEWLVSAGQYELAEKFSTQVYKYQVSPRVTKMLDDYTSNER